MLSARIGARFSIGVVAGIILAVAPVSAAGAHAIPTPVAPHITASPNNVMVNTSTTLTGIGFQRSSTIMLQECSLPRWNVRQHVCVTGNGVTLTTNGQGGFTTSFKVELCPRVPTTTPPPPTSRTCYIGAVRPTSAPTNRLIGAAKVTVTYP